MPPKGLKNIAIPEELYERLKALRKSHQAFSGVIEDLLKEHDDTKPTDKLVVKEEKDIG